MYLDIKPGAGRKGRCIHILADIHEIRGVGGGFVNAGKVDSVSTCEGDVGGIAPELEIDSPEFDGIRIG